MSRGALPFWAVPSVRRMPLRVSPTASSETVAGEEDPFAWCALVIAVRRRVIVAGRCVAASEVRYRATVSGVAGRKEAPRAPHHCTKCRQSAA